MDTKRKPPAAATADGYERMTHKMNHRNKYSIFSKEKIGAAAVIAVILILIGVVIGAFVCRGEDELVRCWILCKPGSQVNVRRTPDKRAMEVGYLEVGDWFLTDGTSSDGWIRCYGIGEYGEGWIYSGYVAIEEPKPVYEQYVCVAKTRVACRKWIDGPKVDGHAWLTNGSNVQVFYIAGDWAITSRGYIRSEWLEVDPR